MARYIDGHTPVRSNPGAGDAASTVVMVGAVVLGSIVLIKVVGENGGQSARDFIRSLPIPEGLKPTEYPMVPGSVYMDGNGRWCWKEQKPDGTVLTKCCTQAGFDPGICSATVVDSTAPGAGGGGGGGGGGSW